MNFRRQLLALSLAALGCESIAPRATPDGSVDVGVTVDTPDVLTSDLVDASVVDAPDVIAADVVDAQTADIVDVPDVHSADIVDAPVADAPDVVTADIVDAPVVDTPDVVTGDIVDAAIADTPDVLTPDLVDASVADAPDVVITDIVDASVNPFPSTGADGPFPGARVPNDAGVIELEARVWNFTSIEVAQGVRVQLSRGSGVLELRATLGVEVSGSIDVSGGPGGAGDIAQANSLSIGGDTAIPHARRTVVGGFPATTASGGGMGVAGLPGICTGGSTAHGGRFGGGNASTTCINQSITISGGGGGGGGFAGGGGGFFPSSGGFGFPGAGASHRSDQGGRGANVELAAEGGEARLLGTSLAVYAGGSGVRCHFNSGWWASTAGGGSIGRAAARDLQVLETFQPGSGGGGGCAQVAGSGPSVTPGGGGGGGGGALRISSPRSIEVFRTGRLVANGGAGGTSGSPCTGGGGSGGVLFLAAPTIRIYGLVSAVGGAGGAGSCAFGSGGGSGTSGAGGLGRVRLSVDPLRCESEGTSNPPIPTGCAPSPDGGVPGQAYVGAWPN